MRVDIRADVGVDVDIIIGIGTTGTTGGTDMIPTLIFHI